MAKLIEKIILGILVVVMLNLGTFLVTALVTDKSPLELFARPEISEQQAVSIAANLLAGPVTGIDLQRENGILVYSVESEQGTSETEVKIDANTGQVLKVQTEDELGLRELAVVNAQVSAEQAAQIALSVVPGTVTEIEVTSINNQVVYEVEVDSNGIETDVVIDVVTGQVLAIEQEVQEDISNVPSKITEEEAKQIALAKLGGTVTDIETDREAGKLVYEVEIRKNGREYDVLVEIETGNILGVESD